MHICPTPLGNLEDITLRVLRVLKESDLIAAEDTRHTRKLLSYYEIHTPVISYHQHSSRHQVDRLVAQILEGKSVALVSDAGTPGISDPGQVLISACLDMEIEVDPLPGPCAAVAAISASGFPLAAFTFLGFLPRKGLNKSVGALARYEHPIVLYESPRRIVKLLESLNTHMPEREVLLARELTKVYQQLIHGKPKQLVEILKNEDLERGEFTVVLGPWRNSDSPGADYDELAGQLLGSGMAVKEASIKLSQETGMPRREAYNILVTKKKKDN